MKNNIINKEVVKEMFIFLKVTLLGLFIFTVFYTFLVDYFDTYGFPIILQIIIAPLFSFGAIWIESYVILLFLPYLIYKCVFLLLIKYKISNNILYFITIIFLVFLNWIFIPILFSCQLNYKDGYFLTKYQACYGIQTGVLEGGTYEAFRIKGADLETFSRLNNDYAKDKNKVYYDYAKLVCDECLTVTFDPGKGLKDADPLTFEIISGKWAKDKNHVYYAGEAVEGADLPSFEVLENGNAKDRVNLYKNGVVIDQ